MQYKFLNIFLDPKKLLAQAEKPINRFLLENNSSQVEKIYEFYKGNVNLLYVNGFLGTGKVEIVDYSTAFLSSETIILKYNCFNSTILDDMLLSFFAEFKKLITQNVILEHKVKTENFTQKINSYFSQIEKPFVIIIDSFEAILEENRQEILDFIFHLNSIPKIKIIIIGRTFENKYFKDRTIERVSTFALEKQIFEKYVKSEKIKCSTAILAEFYKHTRGYYFFTALSIILMKNENLSLTDFLIKVKDSFLPFATFLGKQALTLVPATDRNLFWFLAIIRHPINIELLKQLNFYDEEKFESLSDSPINFLIENRIIIQDRSQIYVQDYLKEQADESISPNIAQKVRQYIVDLYLTQLPLKPLERNICISRQTMRKEIEYHKLFLPKRPKNIENVTTDINYLSYAKVFDLENKSKIEEKKEDAQQQKSPQIDLTQRKNISINLENLPFQNKGAAQKPKSSSNNLNENKEVELEEEILSLKEIMEQAKQAENRYNYAKTIDLYKRALFLKDEKNYQTFLPLIYTKLAYAYQKIANYENALKYYESAQNFYEKTQNLTKVNYIKFNIAKIFYETYKIEKAKEMFLAAANSKDSPVTLVVKSYMQLANIEEGLSNSQKAFEYYKFAIKLCDETINVETLSELYFKYALSVDDKNDIKTAIDFYEKCINLSSDFKINKFLSPSYSNIATLYLEKNDTENALKNYLKAYEIDEKSNNIEGMYYSSSKLASILQRKQPEVALKYFNTSLDCAKLTKDIFYIISAYLAIGDYLYDQKQNEIALKNYLYALELANNNFSQDNISKINIRINDIKFRLGVEKFEALVNIIREQKHE